MKRVITSLIILTIIGCAGRYSYEEPLLIDRGSDSKLLKYSLLDTWNAAQTALADSVIEIVSADEQARTMVLKYSGDKDIEDFVDCGWIHAYVFGDRGGRHYKFPASRGDQSYETMTTDGTTYITHRYMDLDAELKLTFVSESADTTRVTAKAHYVLTRKKERRGGDTGLVESEETIEFDTGGNATFEEDHMEEATICTPTGNLELEPLSLMQRKLTYQ